MGFASSKQNESQPAFEEDTPVDLDLLSVPSDELELNLEERTSQYNNSLDDFLDNQMRISADEALRELIYESLLEISITSLSESEPDLEPPCDDDSLSRVSNHSVSEFLAIIFDKNLNQDFNIDR